MEKFSEIEYKGIKAKKEYEDIIEKVLAKCFEIENIQSKNLYISIILTTPEEREVYKKFWSEYSKAKTSEEKEILALKRELYDLKNESQKYNPIRKFYKNKLVEFGVMRALKNKARTINNIKYIKVK